MAYMCLLHSPTYPGPWMVIASAVSGALLSAGIWGRAERFGGGGGWEKAHKEANKNTYMMLLQCKRECVCVGRGGGGELERQPNKTQTMLKF